MGAGHVEKRRYATGVGSGVNRGILRRLKVERVPVSYCPP
jgi:hypothetical protein